MKKKTHSARSSHAKQHGLYQHIEGDFNSEDGIRLFYQTWRSHDSASSSKKQPVLILIHGMAEHSDRYQFLVDYFVPRGYVVYAMDLRGHGRSGGRRVYADTLEQMVEDVNTFVSWVTLKEKGHPTFLIGHSFGGQLVLNYGVRASKNLSGILVSSPNIQLRVRVPWIKLVLAPILSRYLPKLALSNELDPALVSRNEEIVEAYRTDDMIMRKITTRLANELLYNQTHIMDLASKFKTPIFMMHGGDDHVCDPSGTMDFFKKIPIRDKALKIYDGYYHEIFNEHKNEREEVFGDMAQWMGSKI